MFIVMENRMVNYSVFLWLVWFNLNENLKKKMIFCSVRMLSCNIVSELLKKKMLSWVNCEKKFMSLNVLFSK